MQRHINWLLMLGFLLLWSWFLYENFFFFWTRLLKKGYLQIGIMESNGFCMIPKLGDDIIPDKVGIKKDSG